MFRKLISVLVSAALFLGSGVSVFAEEDEGGNENVGATPTPTPTPTPTATPEPTYYTYNYYQLDNAGSILGLNLNVSRVTPVVLSVAYGDNVSYAMFFVLYAKGFVSWNEANAAKELAVLKGVPKKITTAGSISWTYESLFTGGGSVGAYNNPSGEQAFYYYTYIGYLQRAWDRLNNDYYLAKGAYCWNNTDLWTNTQISTVNISSMVEEYIKFKLLGQLNSEYTIGTVPAKTWLKSGETIAPIIDVEDLPQGNGQGVPGSGDGGGSGGGGDTPGTEPGDDGSGGSGGTMSQQQTQTIANGALTQSQSIDEGAVSVNVTNNNNMSQEQRSWIDSVINNFSLDDQQHTLGEGISNILGLTGVARAWVEVSKVFLGLFPSWVGTVFGVAMSLTSVMVAFRVIHLFV